MLRLKALIFLSALIVWCSDSFSQSEELPIQIFGYFQNQFQYQTIREDEPTQTSFSLQQANIFLQKDFAQKWTAFFNVEFLNTFSSSRQTGAINVEEAWLKYGPNEKFNLKFGLLIPIFNNLNEINNRTPLLPYIFRPIIYETSYSEIVEIEEFVPSRAFIQTYGFLPVGEGKLDYAFYVGNSPNIDNDRFGGRNLITGIDTTDTFLVGGRIGARFKELKVGLSATHDKTNRFQFSEFILGGPPTRFIERPRTRLGGDLSYNFNKFSFEGEFVTVTYDENAPELEFDKSFYYSTLGYHFTEKLFAYGSYWFTKQDFTLLDSDDRTVNFIGFVDFKLPTFGIAYYLNDRVTLKGQFVHAEIDFKAESSLFVLEDDTFNFYSIAASVIF